MNDIDLPPLSGRGEEQFLNCATVRLYLAVLDELPLEQVRVLSEHIRSCRGCSEELQALRRASHMVASLPESAPSQRVDSVIYAALASLQGNTLSDTQRRQAMQRSEQVRSPQQPQPLVRVLTPTPVTGKVRTPVQPLKKRRRPVARFAGVAALAAVLLLAVLSATFLLSHLGGFGASPAQAFTLPANLSWSGYVLHYTQTEMGHNGTPYHVETYHNLGTGQIHVETTAGKQLDVIAVGDTHSMLGEDMMHRVAQWGADAWAEDESFTDLTALRHALDHQDAVYLGTGVYHGQPVYRIHLKNGQILLLNMHYVPVDVLSTQNGASVYDSFEFMKSEKVPESMWDMTVPSGFSMGKLPVRP